MSEESNESILMKRCYRQTKELTTELIEHHNRTKGPIDGSPL